MADLSRRSPGLWIGLAAGALALIACLSALALMIVLAWLRAGPMGGAATPSPDLSVEATALSTPARPVGKATGAPSGNLTWPLENVPEPAGADLGTLVGSPGDISVFTDQDLAEVLGFYQDQMETLGWTKISYGTRITKNDAELHYQNDLYHATVVLARIPFVGTLVEIHLRPL